MLMDLQENNSLLIDFIFVMIYFFVSATFFTPYHKIMCTSYISK